MSTSSRRSSALEAAALCLACSCSLPPRKTSDEQLFVTRCCNRPICPTCVSANPRLTRYDPCLHCQGGVGAVSARRTPGGSNASGGPENEQRTNVDGALRDQDTFVLGDDDESDAGSAESEQDAQIPLAPPAYAPDVSSGPVVSLDTSTSQNLDQMEDKPHVAQQPDAPEQGSSAPSKYYIKPDDTLFGIALKFAVDGRLLCRLNGLPPSTLRTTPHLLHTRTFLALPPSARGPTPARKEDPALQAQRARERAEKRLQTLTKEVDWRVARAYVAVADLHDTDNGDDELSDAKRFERSAEKPREVKRGDSGDGLNGQGRMEECAIDRYLDDDEWEERERREGRGVALPRFPYLQEPVCSGQTGGSGQRSWWQW